MLETITKLDNKRVCYACGSDKTWKGKHSELWRHDKDGNWLCNKCYSKLITNPKWSKINHVRTDKKRIIFKGHRIYLDYEPRIGVCNWCRRVVPFDTPNTEMHHEQYDQNNPSKNIIEICSYCHEATKSRNRGKFV